MAEQSHLAKLEVEHAERNAEIKRRRLELPWVPVENKYEFETEAGRRTLAALFEGRSQLLAYKRRRRWQLPYVSTDGTDFAFDFGLAGEAAPTRLDIHLTHPR